MRILISALLMLIAPQALAQGRDEAAIRGIVANIYKDYNRGDDPGATQPRLSPGFAATRQECEMLGARIDKLEPDGSYGTCSNDYDPFCQCQDSDGIDFDRMKITVTFPARNRAEAVLRWSGDAVPDLKLLFVRGRTGWELDDLWEYSQTEGGGEPDHRIRLTKDIAEMRARLKLPAWKAPAR